jgi:hypothetical protein
LIIAEFLSSLDAYCLCSPNWRAVPILGLRID